MEAAITLYRLVYACKPAFNVCGPGFKAGPVDLVGFGLGVGHGPRSIFLFGCIFTGYDIVNYRSLIYNYGIETKIELEVTQ